VSNIQKIQTHPDGESRLPEGQTVTEKWPVLTYGPTPRVSTDDWRLRLWGACENPCEITWEQLSALPFVRVQADMHCVTTWSHYDFIYGGYRVRDILALAQPTAACTHVMQHAYGGYTTNTSLADVCEDDALMVTEVDNEPLDIEHGGPARIVVPKLWAWKGAKWVNGFEMMTRDRRGFWEVNGYHNHADPWGPGEERYSHQEQAFATRKQGNQLRRRS
jgi:DMSO/TMAO reductase YedYZ molybdopterin-dependent catalytic subunit